MEIATQKQLELKWLEWLDKMIKLFEKELDQRMAERNKLREE